MNGLENTSFIIAFTAGLISFLSPCILPLVPSYLSYIAGISFEEMQNVKTSGRKRFIAFISSVFFVLGFSFIFIILGVPFIFLSRLFIKYIVFLRKIGGGVVILFGLYLIGILKLNFLEKELKIFSPKKIRWKYLSAFLVGCAFALGWSPCIGPILSSILIFSATRETAIKGIILLCLYSFGLAIPFLLSSIAINTFIGFFSRFRKFIRIGQVFSGFFLILMGVLIYIGKFNLFISK